jgi:hypothetical protein
MTKLNRPRLSDSQDELTMNVHATACCREFAHPEISFEASASLPRDPIDSFVSALESMVASGSVFRPEQTLQYGWTFLKFQADDHGGLVLMEPDLSKRPLQYRRGLTETFVQNLWQVYTADSYRIDRALLDFPHIHQSAMICRNFATAERIHLARLDRRGPDDSGWFFGCYKMECDHNSESNLRSVTLVDAVCFRPEISNWVSLPCGVTVLLQPGEKPILLTPDGALNLIPGSFVDALFKRGDG